MSWARMGRAQLVGLVLLASGCGQDGTAEEAATIRSGQLETGLAARVGGQTIAIEEVVAIASSQGMSLQQARERAVFDALMAEEAAQRGLEHDPMVVVYRRGLLADALLDKIEAQAASEPITDADVELVTARHWLELDRPIARKPVHAVVRLPDDVDAAKRQRAKQLAEEIAQAVKGLSEPAAFIEKAKQVPAEGLEVVVEELPPITQDGRGADPRMRLPPGAEPQRFDSDFAAALWKLQDVGALSPPSLTSFGWHVIMLVSVQPESRVGLDERRRMLRDEIIMTRTRERVDALMARLKERERPEVLRNAGAAMDLVGGRVPGDGEGQ